MYNNEEAVDYLEKLRPILDKHEYDIKKIVMIGIGNPPNLRHLEMLLVLRDYFRKNTDIEIVCQEQFIPSKEYRNFMESKDINIKLITSEDWDIHQPIAREMGSNTLVFAPTAAPIVMKVLKKDPELYIGVSMQRQQEACAPYQQQLRMDAQIFWENNYECAEVPESLYASFHTGSNPLVFYRRSQGRLGKQAAWNNTEPHWSLPPRKNEN